MYPIVKSEKPNKDRLLKEDCIEIDNKCEEHIFPQIISKTHAFTAGCEESKWQDLYECMLIYCSEHNIQKMFFVWDNDFYEYDVLEWKKIFPECPEKYREKLSSDYNIGRHLPLSDTPRNTLTSWCVSNFPVQMYMSKGTKAISSSVSKTIPKLSDENSSCVDIIQEQNINAYAHSSCAFNLAKPDTDNYIGRLLSYCTAHSFLGTVFHCGKQVKIDFDLAYNTMFENIVNGIRSQKLLSSKFLLETPAGQGTEMLTQFNEFLDFINELKQIEDIEEHIGVCVDTCHVFAAGYDPYNYIKELNKYINIDLVHFNDSVSGWNCKVDRHADIGCGKIPWPLLCKVASFCNIENIDMVFEC